MLNKPRNLAPEPYFSAYHDLLYQVATYVRVRSRGSNRLEDEELFDLMDAIHNVPEFLIEYGFFDECSMREIFLEPFDEKWVRSPDDFSLVRELDAALERVSTRSQKS